jgi:hypothetical protein
VIDEIALARGVVLVFNNPTRPAIGLICTASATTPAA